MSSHSPVTELEKHKFCSVSCVSLVSRISRSPNNLFWKFATIRRIWNISKCLPHQDLAKKNIKDFTFSQDNKKCSFVLQKWAITPLLDKMGVFNPSYLLLLCDLISALLLKPYPDQILFSINSDIVRWLLSPWAQYW